jgi:hypothetical protein
MGTEQMSCPNKPRRCTEMPAFTRKLSGDKLLNADWLYRDTSAFRYPVAGQSGGSQGHISAASAGMRLGSERNSTALSWSGGKSAETAFNPETLEQFLAIGGCREQEAVSIARGTTVAE